MSSFYVLNVSPLLDFWFINIFSSRLPFHFVYGFLCCVETFQLDVVLLVSFCSCCFWFWYQIQKTIAKTYVKEITTHIFL